MAIATTSVLWGQAGTVPVSALVGSVQDELTVHRGHHKSAFFPSEIHADVWEHLPVTAGRSCSRGATGEATPRDWKPAAAALPGQGTATSQSSLGMVSPATAPPAPQPSLQQLRVNPLNLPFSQGRGNVLWVTRMAPVGCNCSHLSHSPCARMAYPGDKWQWRGSSGICSSAVGFLFVFYYCLGCHSGRCARLMGAGWDSLPSPQGRQGWGRTKLLSIKDEPLILLFTLLLPLSFSNCL